jgi:NitT/TauT family transport system substrate-binding protein
MKLTVRSAGILVVLVLVCVVAYWIASTRPHETDSTGLVHVRIGYLPIAAGLPLFVAIENKYLEEGGFEVEAVRFSSSNELGAAAAAGRVDVMMPFALNAAFDSAAASGKRPLLFGTNEYRDKFPHIVDYLVARPDAHVKSLTDVRGKRVGGFPGSVTKVFVTQILAQAGVQPSEYTYVELAPQDWQPSLQSGSIDIASVMEPQFSQIMADGVAEIVVAGFFAKLMPDVPLSGHWFAQGFSEGQSEETRALFVSCYDRAVDFIRSDPDKARLMYQNYVPARADILPKVQLNHWDKSTELNNSHIQAFVDLLYSHSALRERVNVSEFIYRRH